MISWIPSVQGGSGLEKLTGKILKLCPHQLCHFGKFVKASDVCKNWVFDDFDFVKLTVEW